MEAMSECPECHRWFTDEQLEAVCPECHMKAARINAPAGRKETE